jgi:hypothetical protein
MPDSELFMNRLKLLVYENYGFKMYVSVVA